MNEQNDFQQYTQNHDRINKLNKVKRIIIQPGAKIKEVVQHKYKYSHHAKSQSGNLSSKNNIALSNLYNDNNPTVSQKYSVKNNFHYYQALRQNKSSSNYQNYSSSYSPSKIKSTSPIVKTHKYEKLNITTSQKLYERYKNKQFDKDFDKTADNIFRPFSPQKIILSRPSSPKSIQNPQEIKVIQIQFLSKTRVYRKSLSPSLINLESQQENIVQNYKKKLTQENKYVQLDDSDQIDHFEQQSIFFNKYVIDSQIGKGVFSQVFDLKHLDSIKSTKILAVKVYDKQHFDENKSLYQKVGSEIQILTQIKHPNIVRIHDLYYTPKKIYIVMEHGGYNSLQDVIKNLSRGEFINIIHIKSYFSQLMKSLEYLHQMNIAHRNIQLKNILVKDGSIKLIDFAQSCKIWQGMRMNNQDVHQSIMSPEMVLKKKYCPIQADIWATGVVLYNLVTKTQPFFHDNQQEMLKQIQNNVLGIPSKIVSTSCRDLLLNIFQTNPLKRPSASQILSHKWFTEYDHL